MRYRLSRSPGRLFYGWRIVIVGCILDAVKGGSYNTGLTLYFLPVLNELNLTPAATSLPFSVSKLACCVAACVSAGGLLRLVPLGFIMRGAPESMGLLPDGERRPALDTSRGTPALHVSPDDPNESTATEALRTPAFWLLAAFHSLRNVPYSGVTVHLVPLLVWKGLDEPRAALFVGLTAFCTVIVRPITGWLGDRQSKQTIGATGVFLGALGLAVLTYGGGGLTALVGFAFLFSFGDAINSVTWALV